MKTMIKGFGIAIFTAMLIFALVGCGDGGAPSPFEGPPEEEAIEELGSPVDMGYIYIQIPLPVIGEVPVQSIENEQYSGTVTWEAPDGTENFDVFSSKTYFTATITLTFNEGYTPQGDESFIIADPKEGVLKRYEVELISLSFNGDSNSCVIKVRLYQKIIHINIKAPVNGATPDSVAGVTGNSLGMDYFNIGGSTGKGSVSWAPRDSRFLANTVYTVSIMVPAPSGYTFNGLSYATINGQDATITRNTGTGLYLSYTFPATDNKTVTGIRVKTQPNKRTYIHGDTLDLTGLVVTLTYNDNTTEDVPVADFNAKNITANPAAGTNLSTSTHNGKPITITYGDLTFNTGNLTVNKANFISVPTLTLTPGTYSLNYTFTASNPPADSYDIYWQIGGLTAAELKTYGLKITGVTGGGSINRDGYSSAALRSVEHSMVVTANKAGYNEIDSAVQTATPFQADLARWARTVSGSLSPRFTAVAVDSSGNVYAVGGRFLVKYDPNGNELWTRTSSSESNNIVWFNSVAVDSSDNIYVAGYQTGYTFTYGSGVSALGSYTGDFNHFPDEAQNAILVKYAPNGNALWVRTTIEGNHNSEFNAVSVDPVGGGVYVVGYQTGTSVFNYGTKEALASSSSVNSAQGSSFSKNAVLVCYNRDGYVRSVNTVVSTGDGYSEFNAVSAMNHFVYVTGYQTGYTFTYGSGVSAQGTEGVRSHNAVLVCYSINGFANWARTVSTGNGSTIINAVAASEEQHIIMGGFGNVVIAGSNDSGAVLVGYDYNGNEKLKAVGTGNNWSAFNAVTMRQGRVYVAGFQRGNGVFTYGTGVSAQGTGIGEDNAVLVHYDYNGTAQWARSVSVVGSFPVIRSIFNAVALSKDGKYVYAVGYKLDSYVYAYGRDVYAQGGVSGSNAVLVKYRTVIVADYEWGVEEN